MVDISSELNLDELLHKVMQHATNLCDGDAGIIALLDEAGDITKIYPYKTPEAIAEIKPPPDRSTIKTAIVNRKTIIANDYPSYPGRIEALAAAGVKAALATPILRKGKVMGVMEVFSLTERMNFTRYHAGLLEAVAKQTAVAIEDARLFENLKKSTDELTQRSNNLQTLLEVSLDITSGLELDELMYKIAKNATELTGADAGAVGLLDEEKGVVTYPFIYNLPEVISEVEVPIDGTMTGMAISQRKPVAIEDYQQFPGRLAVFSEAGLRSIILTPLMLRNKAIGALWVSSTHPEKRFDEQDLMLLEGIGRQAAIALENSRLFADAQRKTERLARLFDITQTIGAGLDITTIFKRAVSTVKSIFDVSSAWLTIYDERTGLIRMVEYEGPHKDVIMESVIQRPYFGLDGYAIAENRPQVATDIMEDPRIAHKEEAIKMGARAMISVPIISKGRSIGSIGIGTILPAETPRGRDQLEFLETIATTVATAAENARLYESVKASEQETQRRARELTILINLSNILSQTLELDALMNTAVESMLYLFEADAAAIYLLDEERQVLQLASIKGVSEHFIEESLEIPVGQRLPGAVVETGKPLIIENIVDHPEFEASVVSEEFISLVGAPIRSKGKVIGAFPLASRQFDKFSQSDAALLESIGNELGIAIENSRLYESQRKISELLQKSMLPPYVPTIPDMEIGVKYSSATEEALVGGDFYDIYNVDGKYALIIGDVSGKGIEAASSTSMMKYILRSYLYQQPSPSFALDQANQFVMRQEERATFITVFCAVYDPEQGTVVYSNAGHPYPCLLNQISKTCIILATHDPAVGIISDYKYSENTVTMNPGNFIVAYTDGVIEARSGREFFGEERLVEALLDSLDLPAQSIADAIINTTLKFTHGKLTDDIALLVLKRQLGRR